MRVLDLAEQVPRQAPQSIGLAVAAREQVGDRRPAQVRHRRRFDRAGRIRLEVALDRGAVAEGQRRVLARFDADEAILARLVRELGDLYRRLNRQLFFEDRLRRVTLRLDAEDEGGGEFRRVSERSTDGEQHGSEHSVALRHRSNRFWELAEREGFEPPDPFRSQWFSRPPPSTTRPSLRVEKIRWNPRDFTAREFGSKCRSQSLRFRPNRAKSVWARTFSREVCHSKCHPVDR